MNSKGIKRFLQVAEVGQEITISAHFDYSGSITKIDGEQGYIVVKEPLNFNLESVVELKDVWIHSLETHPKWISLRDGTTAED